MPTVFSRLWNFVLVLFMFSLFLSYYRQISKGKWIFFNRWNDRVTKMTKIFCSLNFNLLERYNEILFNVDIKWMTMDLLQDVMNNTNCFVTVLDYYYQDLIGTVFDRPSDSKPYFKVLFIKRFFACTLFLSVLK